jgi:drug/metabolite transporter (DMT)-like permease
MVFLACSIAYGAAFAGVEQGLKTMSAGLFQSFRMIFAGFLCLIILGLRWVFETGYGEKVRKVFCSSPKLIMHLCIGGILNLGLPHSLISVGQKWVPTASINLVQPVAAGSTIILSHFLIPGERFTLRRGISLGIAVAGASLSSIAPFRHAEDHGTSISQVGIGFVLLVVGVLLFGIAAVYFKWKTPNTDVTLSGVVQLIASSVFCFIWSLCYDGPASIKQQVSETNAKPYVWALIVGWLGSCVGVHAFIYLIETLGAPMANFVTIGQILVGVTVGVLALGEWNDYLWWEILINAFGMILLGGSILIVFMQNAENDKQSQASQEDECIQDIEKNEEQKIEAEIGDENCVL